LAGSVSTFSKKKPLTRQEDALLKADLQHVEEEDATTDEASATDFDEMAGPGEYVRAKDPVESTGRTATLFLGCYSNAGYVRVRVSTRRRACYSRRVSSCKTAQNRMRDW
jgi:hypothetical protein